MIIYSDILYQYLSSSLYIYKTRGVALELGKHRGSQLLDWVMQVPGKVTENLLRQHMRNNDRLHSWTQHHRRHINSAPAAIKEQQNTVHGLCQ